MSDGRNHLWFPYANNDSEGQPVFLKNYYVHRVMADGRAVILPITDDGLPPSIKDMRVIKQTGLKSGDRLHFKLEATIG
jgi:hypothetical protein